MNDNEQVAKADRLMATVESWGDFNGPHIIEFPLYRLCLVCRSTVTGACEIQNCPAKGENNV
jgi:hypothetical protein